MAQLFRRVSTPEKLLRFLEAGQNYVHANFVLVPFFLTEKRPHLAGPMER